MNLRRCENGHFYDADKFDTCPHCNVQVGDNDVTMAFGGGPRRTAAQENEDAVTEAFSAGGYEPLRQEPAPEPVPEQPIRQSSAEFQDGLSLKEAVNIAITEGRNTHYDEEKTVSYYNKRVGQDLVVGWLVCIEGTAFGGSYCLKSGRNFIGRGSDMDICLKGDNSVSRDRHAIILYEPRKREFIAQAGESRELFYVNDDVVLLPRKLQRYDILSIGKTRLMFFPCCDEHFSWEDYKKEGERQEV